MQLPAPSPSNPCSQLMVLRLSVFFAGHTEAVWQCSKSCCCLVHLVCIQVCNPVVWETLPAVVSGSYAL